MLLLVVLYQLSECSTTGKVYGERTVVFLLAVSLEATSGLINRDRTILVNYYLGYKMRYRKYSIKNNSSLVFKIRRFPIIAQINVKPNINRQFEEIDYTRYFISKLGIT